MQRGHLDKAARTTLYVWQGPQSQQYRRPYIVDDFASRFQCFYHTNACSCPHRRQIFRIHVLILQPTIIFVERSTYLVNAYNVLNGEVEQTGKRNTPTR